MASVLAEDELGLKAQLEETKGRTHGKSRSHSDTCISRAR